jgi:hypothetical protein
MREDGLQTQMDSEKWERESASKDRGAVCEGEKSSAVIYSSKEINGWQER